MSPDTSQNAGFSQKNATITLQIEISGHVQNIGFRACTRKIATHLGVTGEVMNLAGGAVLITARGEAFVLEKFISMLYGCPRAVIRNVTTKEVDTRLFNDFVVKKGLF
ncbi:MAG: acylphosphatase [Methanomicrobiaceae archaeon]|nr:acylphosphatase [Methanomicrobiaceae archaeon]